MNMLVRFTHTGFALLFALTGLLAAARVGAQEQGGPANPNGGLTLKTAKVRLDASQNMLLGAALAGSRIVAVGEHGVILLSDDDGAHYRQASVPTDSTLTSVTFADSKHGWAVGHWGVILRTEDAGETWSLQRSDTAIDQPIFSIAFRDAKHGWAVGLWALVLSTDDGGLTWKKQTLDQSSKSGGSGLNLYSVFTGDDQSVYVAGEQGTVFKSTDGGVSWRAQPTGYKGSLWSGAATADHVIYVGGLRGNLFASSDGGESWKAIRTGVGDSITDIKAEKSEVVAVALDGSVITRMAGQSSFKVSREPGRGALTAVAIAPTGAPVLFSKEGVVKN